MSSTDRRTDRRTDKVNPVYPPSNFVGYKQGESSIPTSLGGGIKMFNKQVSHMWVLLADCGELVGDYNRLVKVLQ